MDIQSILNGIPAVFGYILICCGLAVAVIGVVTMYVAHHRDNPGTERSGDIAFLIGQILVLLGGAFTAKTLAAAMSYIVLFVFASVYLIKCLKGK